MMSKFEEAKMLAEFCYKPKHKSNPVEFLLQVFIENVVMPKDMDTYTVREMENLIFDHLMSVEEV